ncbi:MAG: RDD family protein [Candidatus Dormibacteria bacterium]
MPPDPPALPPPPPPPPPGYAPQPPYQYPAPYQQVPLWAVTGPAPGLRYAGFWIRFLAYMIDVIILAIPLGVIAWLILGPSLANLSCTTVDTGFGSRVECTGTQQLQPLFWLVALVYLVIGATYSVVSWGRYGHTLGQKVCGLRVVEAVTGGPITTSRAIGRYLGFIVSTWVLDIGLIWAAFDQRKQGWHDKMASTFVVRKA